MSLDATAPAPAPSPNDAFEAHAARLQYTITLDCVLSGIKASLSYDLYEKTNEQVLEEQKYKDLFQNEVLWRRISECVAKQVKAGEDGKPRQYIQCPYDQKEEAKALGARWDGEQKRWYAIDDITYGKLAKWHASKPTTPTLAPTLAPVDVAEDDPAVDAVVLPPPVMHQNAHGPVRVQVTANRFAPY